MEVIKFVMAAWLFMSIFSPLFAEERSGSMFYIIGGPFCWVLGLMRWVLR